MNVPHLHCRVSITRNKQAILYLHATGETLVSGEGVQASARVYVPNPDRCV